MSGRSGYRKTTRRRDPNAKPRQRFDYLLRFQLPQHVAFAVSPGQHGWGISVGFNDVVFAHGRHPRHCCELAAVFLFKVQADQLPAILPAGMFKLPSVPAHTAVQRRQDFAPLSIDLEAIHDRVQRSAPRNCRIGIARKQITFSGAAPRDLVIDARDEQS